MKKINVNGITITYMIRRAVKKKDWRSLIVIFSGFRAKSNFTYDFSGNALSNIYADVLWIKDNFFWKHFILLLW